MRKIGHICWNCYKRFERMENEKKTLVGKLIFCSHQCMDTHEFEVSKLIMKGYDYIPEGGSSI
jgi:hypothetical protein